jgi:predicted lipoprotein with Yx(FWY)xxD motif
MNGRLAPERGDVGRAAWSAFAWRLVWIVANRFRSSCFLAHPSGSVHLYLVDEGSWYARFEGGVMNQRRWDGFARVVAAGVAVALVAAVAASAQTAPVGAARLTVRSSEFGKTLFGPGGHVVYAFGADRASTSRCYGVCAKAWPPLLTGAAPVAGAGVEARLLGTTRRSDGTLQVTYNGHPLYYYSADPAGKIMCQHAVMHGGLWLIVKPNGQPNMAKGKMHM